MEFLKKLIYRNESGEETFEWETQIAEIEHKRFEFYNWDSSVYL